MSLFGLDKENVSHKRKRAMSLGGAALSELRNQQMQYDVLSPRKKARRSLVPGRSILKATGSQNAMGPFYSEEQDTLNLTLTLTNTQTTEDLTDRRKSLSRRVSFAPTAYLREFVKDSPDRGAQDPSSSEADPEPEEPPTSVPSLPQPRQHARKSSITSMNHVKPRASVAFSTANESQDMSMDLAQDDVTAAFSSFQFPAAAKTDSLEEEQMSFADDSAMDLLDDPHAVTSAFAQHTVIQQQMASQPATVASESGSELDEEVSIAMALGAGHEYEVPLGPQGASPDKSRDVEEDTGSTMEESMDMDATVSFGKGLIVSDGFTSRRISVGGTMRKGSLAPGQAALALLDAEEENTMEYDASIVELPEQDEAEEQELEEVQEEDEEESHQPSDAEADETAKTSDADQTVDMDQHAVFSQNYDNRKQPRVSLNPFLNIAAQPPLAPRVVAPSPARRSPGRVVSPVKPSPRRIFSNEPQIARPPSSLASLPAERLTQLRSPSKPSAPTPRSSLALRSPNVSRTPIKVFSSPRDASPRFTEEEDETEEKESATDHTVSALTLEDFFQLTNTQFMDDVFSGKRKSMHQPADAGEITIMKMRPSFADQVVAMGCLVHELEMYYMMSKELRTSLMENTEWVETIERILQEDIPPVFKRYQSASDDERATMERRFHIAKSHFRMEVKKEWYEYRSTAIDSFCQAVTEHLSGIESDRALVQGTIQEADEVIPQLQARKEELEASLEKEAARQAEIDACDQEHLSGLREAIAEQNAQIEEFARENQEVDEDTARAQQKIHLLLAQKQELADSIAAAQQKLSGTGATKATFMQLRDEFQTLQDMQSWRLEQFNGSEVKLIHCHEVCVVLSLGANGINRLELALFEDEKAEPYEKSIKAFLFARMKLLLEHGQKEGAYRSVPGLLRKITAIWATASRLAEEFSLVHKRFPLETRLLSKKSRPASFLRVAARVHCDAAAASFFVQFELTGEETSSAPLDEALCDIGCAVEVQFGQVDVHELTYIVRERVSRGGPLSLLEACMQAEHRFH